MSCHSNLRDSGSNEEYDDIIFAYSHWGRDALIKKLESKYNILEDHYKKLDKQEIIINNISRENNDKASKTTVSSKCHTCLRCRNLSHKGKHCPPYKYFCKTRCKTCEYYHHTDECNMDI